MKPVSKVRTDTGFGLGWSSPIEPQFRVPLVVANDHHADKAWLDVVEKMVGKAFQVGPPEALIRWVKPQRILGGFGNRGLEFCVELLSETRRNRVILPGGLQNIPPAPRDGILLPLGSRPVHVRPKLRCRQRCRTARIQFLAATRRFSETVVIVLPESRRREGIE
jgi:hypothetical protein